MGNPHAAPNNANSRSLADRLEAQRDAIARLCEMRIRQHLPGARPHDVPTLLDHIPQILETMIARLKERPSSSPERADERRISRLHGAQRAELASYTLESILAEYRVIRKAVFEALEKEGPVGSAERDEILDVIQLSAKYAASQFLHERTVRMPLLGWLPSTWAGRSAVSVGIVAVAAGAQWLLSPFLANTPFICFYPAILLACLFADGVVASILSALVAQYVFVEPRMELKLEWPGHAVHLGLFLFNAFLITAVTNMMRKAKVRADILASDHERAKLELENSEASFRELADSIPQLAWTADTNGHITWFNKQWYDYTGTTPEEVTGFTWPAKVQHPDYMNISHARYEEHIRSGKAWEDTFPLRSRTGEWRWFLSRALPIHDAGGKIVRWFGTNTDITEQREARNQIHETSERYKLALDAGKIGVWEMELGSPEITWSPLQYRIFDVDPATSPLTYEVFMSRIHPDDKEKVGREFEAAVRDRRPFRLSYRAVWRDGSVHWVKADGKTYYDASGKPVRMIGTNIDITRRVVSEQALRKSETEFRALADSMPQIVWTASRDGRIEYFNRRFYNYTDLPPEEALGTGYEKAVHPDDLPALRLRWKEAAELELPFEVEHRLRRMDGEYRWHLCRSAPIRDERGRLRRWYGTSTDMDDYRLVISALEEEQRLRERFTNMLTHDLKNPLSAAKMSAQIELRRRGRDPSSEKALHRIEDSISRADKMINDLLDVNRIKAGEPLPLAISKCDLAAVLKGTLEEQALLHGDRFHLQGAESLEGYWAPDALRRVFENLLGNAAKYGSGDTPITVTASRAGGKVLVEVHNFGGELSPADTKDLFTMFRRAKRAEASGKLGWGIGLTLVKGIVEAHGGRTWVESGRGRGTSFFVELPRDSRIPAGEELKNATA